MGFNLNHLQLWVILFPIIYNFDVFAAQNVTIHNQDPSITYSPPGAWTQSAQSPLDVAGTHMLTQNPNATASFNFTGIAIYFLSPLWPYTVNTAVSLDSGPPTLIDLVDHSHSNTGQGPETVQSQVVWNATGLANTQHNLLISVGAGQPYAIVDTLIYTNATNVSTSSSSSMTPTSTSTSSIQEPIIASSTANATSLPPSPKSKPVVAIALGSLFGILGLLVILSALLYFLRRRRRPMSEAWTVASTPYTTSRNPSLSADASNKNGNGNWTADQLYSNNGYYMTQSDDGKTWYNPRYGDVGMPAPAIPSQPYYHGGYPNNNNSRYHHPPPPPSMTNRVPNHYEPGYALSTITERSTPQMGSEKTPPLANNTPASYQSELDYFTAQQGSEASQSHSAYRQQQQQQQQHVPSSLGSNSPNTNIQSYPSSRRKPVEYKSGNWI